MSNPKSVVKSTKQQASAKCCPLLFDYGSRLSWRSHLACGTKTVALIRDVGWLLYLSLQMA